MQLHLVFVTLIVCIISYQYGQYVRTNYLPIYPNQTILYQFVGKQIELVNRHNQYELMNGFVSFDKINLTKQLCEIPTDIDVIKQWWMNYTLLKSHTENTTWEEYVAFCMSGMLNNNIENAICTSFVRHNSIQTFDPLYVASKFCYVSGNRQHPKLHILDNSSIPKWDDNIKRYHYIVKVNITLPNGELISANDDRIKILIDGNDCNFTVISPTQILLGYTNTSGNRYSYYRVIGKKQNCHIIPESFCDDYTFIDSGLVCRLSVAWNWTSPVVNSPIVSYWMTRQPYFRNELRCVYSDINIDVLNKKYKDSKSYFRLC
ncbi:hypothetical protein QKU48_gp0018 [Fadolivirus algeromassiliense]|jgi:hypothetical protein|uniref:Uncharacterized protein n=1 Tax=Fadolivirus FV1/VV64 TaxID=3070911 RepID=A0A7D3V786_9VIRU|nr:hypothetical protein QKU48_gp0018 [Fadolivirus algeromassiliense]QKF93476.1 hypothetical protein Fadolivirus_1_18 [Fadolivirus FV1/VV64]